MASIGTYFWELSSAQIVILASHGTSLSSWLSYRLAGRQALGKRIGAVTLFATGSSSRSSCPAPTRRRVLVQRSPCSCPRCSYSPRSPADDNRKRDPDDRDGWRRVEDSELKTKRRSEGCSSPFQLHGQPYQFGIL